jgi:hypothetical protein
MSLDYYKVPSDQPDPTKTQTQIQLDELKTQAYLREIQDNQNLTLGVLTGAGAALIGAIAWAIVTALTKFQIGFMAIGIGFIVGWTIRQFGRGLDISFGVAGGALAFLGCLLGNLLSACIMYANQTGASIMDTLAAVNLRIAGEILKATFSPMDLLFYGIAIYFGYKYSLFTIPEEKLKELAKAR